jgi:hypothetical protein
MMLKGGSATTFANSVAGIGGWYGVSACCLRKLNKTRYRQTAGIDRDSPEKESCK